MRNPIRLSKKALYKIIADELVKLNNNLYEINRNSNKLVNELHIIEKNTEGLNYILLEDRKQYNNYEHKGKKTIKQCLQEWYDESAEDF